MGNTLGIYRRKDDATLAQDHDHESESDVENTSGDGVAIIAKTPEPNSSDDSQWKTPEMYTGANILKPQQITALIDPRSPNEDISRTPIIIAGEETDLKRKMNNRFLKVNQAVNQVSTEAGSEFSTPIGTLDDTSPVFDPRSPTQDFDRTPVIAAASKKDAFRIKPSRLDVNNHCQED